MRTQAHVYAFASEMQFLFIMFSFEIVLKMEYFADSLLLKCCLENCHQ